ncbi:MFS transporter [Jeotgalibaca sp. A127]|uniref:MFS transporter n=1 Tax=Jeotgalibaca sp. A127 TaxID=3457324 RepID=UPI003FD5915C
MSKYYEAQWQRDISLFLFSQTISLIGSTIVQYAITWHLTLTAKSGFILTLAVIFGFLPTVFIAPFAGVWADRFNRKKVIVMADGFIAIATLILAILFYRGYDSIWVLLIISSIRAFGSGIQSPAVSAVFPQLVPEKKLMRINGLNGTINSMGNLFSPMISGFLLNYLPLATIFMIDVITALIAIIIVGFFIKIPVHKKAREVPTTYYIEDLKSGFTYIRDHVVIRKLFGYYAFAFLMFVPINFLSPLHVARVFGDEVWRLSTLQIAFSAGMIIGGGVVIVSGGFRNRMHSVLFSAFMIGLSGVSMGLVQNFWFFISLMGVVGLVVPLLSTPSMVLLQEKVSEAYLGRVFGVATMFGNLVIPIGMAIFGPLADRLAITDILVFTGLVMIIVALLAFRDKVVIEAGEPVEQE